MTGPFFGRYPLAKRAAKAAPEAGADAELALRVIQARAQHLAAWMRAQPVRVKYAGGFMARLIDLTAAVFRS